MKTTSSARTSTRARLIAAACVIVGAALVAYPSASSWLIDLRAASAASSYVRDVAEADPAVLDGIRATAVEYNASLPIGGPLRDPYALDSDGSAHALDEDLARYEELLALGDGDVIARLRIDDIGVDLPVYHGTAQGTLADGVGHVWGSALPVGGESTHAVFAAHSGTTGPQFFADLTKLGVGDDITVSALGEDLTYRVISTDVVLPSESDGLRVQEGRDLITLVTCVPLNINSHRLLVTAERVEDGAGSEPHVATPADDSGPGFPWSLAAFAGVASGTIAVVVTGEVRRRRAM